VEKAVSVTYVTLAINSASNFVIYMLRSAKFRRALTSRWARCCRPCCPGAFVGDVYQQQTTNTTNTMHQQQQRLNLNSQHHEKVVAITQV